MVIRDDGGKDSGVKALMLEIKSLFSIGFLYFRPNKREAFHSHAFNSLTIWLWGNVTEEIYGGEILKWRWGNIKYTPRDLCHRVNGHAIALVLRGPWANKWYEIRNGKQVWLTHGRKEC